MATAVPLSAAGIEIRPASASLQPPTSPLHIARLLDRLETQLEEEERSKVQDTWSRAEIAIGLSNAGSRLDNIARSHHGASSSSSYGAETSLSVLRARLQRAVAQYNRLSAPTHSPQTRTAPNPLLAPRQFLKQGLMEESESESEDDDGDEGEDVRVEKGSGGQATQARGTAEQLRMAATGVAGKHANVDEGEEEEMKAYEAAAGRREDRSAGERKGAEEGEQAEQSALQSERSVQDSLSGELLRMAGILKANSMAFADALERDRKILEDAGEKLQGNLTLMTRTRGKLGEYSRKARGMGWLTLGSVAVVCMSWIVMFILIRLT